MCSSERDWLYGEEEYRIYRNGSDGYPGISGARGSLGNRATESKRRARLRSPAGVIACNVIGFADQRLPVIALENLGR